MGKPVEGMRLTCATVHAKDFAALGIVPRETIPTFVEEL
jgi:hypothetical protein